MTCRACQGLFFKHTLDTVCEIAFSKQLDSLRRDAKFGQSFDRAQEHIIHR
jgi:hypothetical protein